MTTGNGRVLVIAAHPADPDFLAGGTVARLAKEGCEISWRT
jgi:LmbE family N-acetylglucosaminyl deacetylase